MGGIVVGTDASLVSAALLEVAVGATPAPMLSMTDVGVAAGVGCSLAAPEAGPEKAFGAEGAGVTLGRGAAVGTTVAAALGATVVG